MTSRLSSTNIFNSDPFLIKNNFGWRHCMVNKRLRSSCTKGSRIIFFALFVYTALKLLYWRWNLFKIIKHSEYRLGWVTFTLTPRWRRILVRLLLRCYVHKFMLTLYQEWGIRSRSHFDVSTKCEQQRHRTGTSSHTSNIVPEQLIERVWVLPVPVHTPEH